MDDREEELLIKGLIARDTIFSVHRSVYDGQYVAVHRSILLPQLLALCLRPRRHPRRRPEDRSRPPRPRSLSSPTLLLISLLRSLPSPPDSPFPFNSLLSPSSRSAAHLPALQAYSILRYLSVPIDPSTLPPLLRSATFLSSIAAGLDAHSLALKTGLAARLPIATALIHFYFTLGLPALGCSIFHRCRPGDAVLWNTTIAGLVRCHEFDLAQQLFDEMRPSDRNIASWNTLVDMYCNKMEMS